MYGNASGISFWKKVRKECRRILKNLSRLIQLFHLQETPPTEVSNLTTSVHSYFCHSLSARVVGLSHLLLSYIYVLNLWSYFWEKAADESVWGGVGSWFCEIWDCFLSLCLQSNEQDNRGSWHTLHTRWTFCRLLKVSLFSFSWLLPPELFNSDISERKKRSQRWIVWMLLRLLLINLNVW